MYFGQQQQETDSWPIDGFYIEYAPFDEESAYQRQAVIGGSVRHAVLSHLNSGTSYSIRMQSYTVVGGESDYGNMVVKNTLCRLRINFFWQETIFTSGEIQLSLAALLLLFFCCGKYKLVG